VRERPPAGGAHRCPLWVRVILFVPLSFPLPPLPRQLEMSARGLDVCMHWPGSESVDAMERGRVRAPNRRAGGKRSRATPARGPPASVSNSSPRASCCAPHPTQSSHAPILEAVSPSSSGRARGGVGAPRAARLCKPCCTPAARGAGLRALVAAAAPAARGGTPARVPGGARAGQVGPWRAGRIIAARLGEARGACTRESKRQKLRVVAA